MLGVIARRERVEAHADVCEALHLPGSRGVGHHAAHARPFGDNRLAVHDDGSRDMCVHGLFDSAGVGADARVEHHGQARARGNGDFTKNRGC
jgi:hypothetical protein